MTNLGFELLDPRPRQRENPYTFFRPGDDELDEVAEGQLVKLMFRAVPPSDEYDAERMWVKVTHRDDDRLTGTLDNDPADIPGLKDGDPVAFQFHHIIGIIWDDADQKEKYKTDFDGWFARCFVDDAVLDGRARVGFIYREEPEDREGDTYPDSGWRIRADVDQLSDEEYDDPDVSYVAIGAVLNRDDSFLGLLFAPVGSAFLREEGNAYAPTTLNDDDHDGADD